MAGRSSSRRGKPASRRARSASAVQARKTTTGGASPAGTTSGTPSSLRRTDGQLPTAFRAQATPAPIAPPVPGIEALEAASRRTPAARRDPAAARSVTPSSTVAAPANVTADPFVAVRPALVADAPTGPVQVSSLSCSPIRDVDPQGLAVTYWFDAAPSGEPYPVSVRFTGRRLAAPASEAVSPAGGEARTFEVVHTLDPVLPGSGRIALTARVPHLAPGDWEVTATPVRTRDAARPAATRAQLSGLRRGAGRGHTTFLPAVRVLAPGARLGAWPSLVGLGAVLAVVVQALLAAERQLPVGRLVLVSTAACLLGLVGAKVYYLVTHPAERGSGLRAGMSVQGFVIAGLTTVTVGSWMVGIPVGPMLDVTAPGLLVGLTIGRLGCFFGGCCAGRPTASRWGVWSSDRRVGVRRIPVQLMESTLAAVVAAGTLAAVLLVDPAVDGLLMVAGLAAYIGGRQVLFPLRGVPRVTSWGRVTTLVVAVAVFTLSVVVLVVVPVG